MPLWSRQRWNLSKIKSRSSFVLAIGFGTLIVLTAVLGLGAIRRARAIYRDMQLTQDAYMRAETSYRDIASDMYLADILVRDYLLDPSPHNAPRHREALLSIRNSLQGRLDYLSTQTQDTGGPRLSRLNDEVQEYWDSLDPIFDWTQKQKAEMSWSFLRHNVLPRRQAVVDLARAVSLINRTNLEREQQRIQDSQQVLRTFLLRMMVFALSLGSIVALVTTYRVAALETQHEQQRKQIEETQNNLRRLSRRLVQAQEMERKTLSRELHDEIGQTLTALGIELGNIEKARNAEGLSFRSRIEDAKQLNASAVRAIRDLAMGLRPSMLDDLGLEAALEWQGREFSRRTGVPATVQVEGSLNDLADAHRTCIYRVVQEALTNCARHAEAKNVFVSVSGQDSGISVVVQDDGKGFDTHSSTLGGLGLLGMQERVQALEGHIGITSQLKRGTTIRVELPIGTAT